jgi:hypothetical protein
VTPARIDVRQRCIDVCWHQIFLSEKIMWTLIVMQVRMEVNVNTSNAVYVAIIIIPNPSASRSVRLQLCT